MTNEDRETRIRDHAYKLWEKDGSPDGKHEDHWSQAEHEIDKGDGEIEGDDVPNLAALREAARQHGDAYIVPSDMEDADQREASPGTREQP